MDAPCNWSLLIQLPESSDCLEKGLNDHQTVGDDECSWYSSGDEKSDLMIMRLNPRGEAALDSGRARGGKAGRDLPPSIKGW
jgi:hypothetical protein